MGVPAGTREEIDAAVDRVLAELSLEEHADTLRAAAPNGEVPARALTATVVACAFIESVHSTV